MAIKIWKAEFIGAWSQKHPIPSSGALKFSCGGGGGSIKITPQKGPVKEYQIKSNRTAWIVNDIICFPFAK